MANSPQPNMPPSYAGSGGGGMNVYITVAGDTDPDAAARRIWIKLRELKRHQGGRSLDL
jgi:hypothetical protein